MKYCKRKQEFKLLEAAKKVGDLRALYPSIVESFVEGKSVEDK